MPELRTSIIKLARDVPWTRQYLVPIIREAASTSPTEEGAQHLFETYKHEHPGTKKSPRDFYAPSSTSKPKTKLESEKPSNIDMGLGGKHLPERPSQAIHDRKKLFDQAREAHEQQLDWFDRGKGLGVQIGASIIRADKGDPIDLSKPGTVIVIGPMKGEKRSAEKVKANFDGDWGHLTDIVRATIATDSKSDLKDVISNMKKSGIKLASRPRDRFQNPTEAGYRDIVVNVRYPNGHIGELQLNLKPILRAKKEGHLLYEKVRTIEAAAKGKRENMTDEERNIVDTANKAQKDLYEAAWKEAQGISDKSPKTAKVRQKEPEYFDWNGIPVKWDNHKFPMKVVKGKESPIYTLQKLFNEATPISKKDFESMIRMRS